MAVYRILEVGHPALREKAERIPRIHEGIHRLLTNLADTMYEANGVGLAAPQIGISKRVIVVDVGEGLLELINPEIIVEDGKVMGVEGCLSLPGIQGEVSRAERVTVRALDREGRERQVKGEGLLARALQHEIDHLDGILLIDKATRLVEDEREHR